MLHFDFIKFKIINNFKNIIYNIKKVKFNKLLVYNILKYIIKLIIILIIIIIFTIIILFFYACFIDGSYIFNLISFKEFLFIEFINPHIEFYYNPDEYKKFLNEVVELTISFETHPISLSLTVILISYKLIKTVKWYIYEFKKFKENYGKKK